MSDTTRHAAGFLLFRESEDGRRWLLLKNARHGAWGFPKGHAERGEDSLTCARRELEEETGLVDIEIVRGYRDIHEYDVVHPKRGPYHKIVTYFLAGLESGEVRKSDEHSEVSWAVLDDALATLEFTRLREALRLADEFLSKQEP